jgi:hypothetical protein
VSGPFLGSEAVAGGLVSRDQLRGPRFRRVFPDVYLPSSVELDLVTRSMAAYLLVRDRDGVLGGYSAAVLLDAGCGPYPAPAEVIVPRRARAHPGLRITRGEVTGADRVLVEGCRVTTPLRTAWDLGRRPNLVEAVVAVDALAHRHRFAPAALLARRAATPGARGCRRLHRVVQLADPRAESPRETRLRLGLVLAGLPPPTVQHRVLDEYGFELARVDLAYPEAKLAIEYDGATHFDARRARLDRQRDAELASCGWQTLRLVDDDLAGMPQTVHRVRRLLELRARSLLR